MWLCRYRPLVASVVGHGLNLFLCSDHRLAVRNDSKRRRLAGGGGGGGQEVVVDTTAAPLAMSVILAERRRQQKRLRGVVLSWVWRGVALEAGGMAEQCRSRCCRCNNFLGRRSGNLM